MRRFKVVVLSKSEHVKYTYEGSFSDMQQAIHYYQMNGGRVIDCKEIGVRLKAIKGRAA